MDDAPAPWLGCIADDVTGATDLASNLVQGGMSAIQWLRTPTVDEMRQYPAQAVIVAQKTRSLDPRMAVDQSLHALSVLREAGCQRYFFKYCSTFDSTERGNIGPIADALMQTLGVSQAVFCPAFPKNLRTVYQGHLFVGARLLNESGMERHPLNPMTDANLVRFLGKQTLGKIGLLAVEQIEGGAQVVREHLQHLASQGVSHVISDSLNDRHLQTLAAAWVDLRLLTGGSGIARFLPAAYRQAGLLEAAANGLPFAATLGGRQAILAGSCSAMTNRQVAAAEPECYGWRLQVPQLLANPDQERQRFSQWLEMTKDDRPLLIYSTDDPSAVAAVQQSYGREAAAQAIEEFHADAARELVRKAGVRALVVAGGETSGAVVRALQVHGLRIGQEICPGVPWTTTIADASQPTCALALKSGNFGDEDFFLRALRVES